MTDTQPYSEARYVLQWRERGGLKWRYTAPLKWQALLNAAEGKRQHNAIVGLAERCDNPRWTVSAERRNLPHRAALLHNLESEVARLPPATSLGSIRVWLCDMERRVAWFDGLQRALRVLVLDEHKDDELEWTTCNRVEIEVL